MNESLAALDTVNFAPLSATLELLLSEQVADWKRGDRRSVKSYLDRHPEFLEQVEARIELINQEIVLRRRGGESPQLGEYLVAFPELAGPLTQLFDIHAAISLPSHSLSTPRWGEGGLPAHRPINLPGYAIERKLGSGGMGDVYLANDLTLKRRVAIKVLRARLGDDPRARERFGREAAAVAKCQHPNLVQIFQVGESESDPYLVLEYVEGDTLAMTLAGRPRPPREAAMLVEKLARAIEHAHGRGVVHRDLKPSNVLMGANGEPKISDFGLALLDDRSTRTEEGAFLGTPAYMAPEQVSSAQGEVGPLADIHALGIILYEALTGRIPFRGNTLEETLNRILRDEADPPSRHEPAIPADLQAICLKCLEKRPVDRYRAAVDLAEDLRRFLDGRPTLARPLSLSGRVWRWSRRNRKEAILSALVAGSLILGSIVSFALAARAIRAEAGTRLERDRAETEAAITRVINDFLRNDLLAQASAESQAEFGTTPNPNLTVREALDRAAARVGERFREQPRVEATIEQTIGDTYLEIGLYPQALPHLERSLTLRRRDLGDKHPDTLAVMESIGTLYLSDGKLSEAEPYLDGAAQGLRSARGPDHPETLKALRGLAHLYFAQDKLAEAEDLITQARNILLSTRGIDDIETIAITNSLALIIQSRKQLEPARKLLIESLERSSSKLGVDHPVTLTIKSNLAGVYVELGDKTEAARLYEEAIEGRSRVLGKRHPDTLDSMIKLGCMYGPTEQLDQPAHLVSEALKAGRAALDRNHEATDAALAGLASVYIQKRDMKRLGEVLVEAAEISRFRWGPDYGLVNAASQLAGTFMLLQGEFAKAEPYLRDCLNFWLKKGPDQHERFLGELSLGVALLGQREFAESHSRLLTAYRGLAPRDKSGDPSQDIKLGMLVERLITLADQQGRLAPERSLEVLRNNPVIRMIILDHEFPSKPFAPP